MLERFTIAFKRYCTAMYLDVISPDLLKIGLANLCSRMCSLMLRSRWLRLLQITTAQKVFQNAGAKVLTGLDASSSKRHHHHDAYASRWQSAAQF